MSISKKRISYLIIILVFMATNVFNFAYAKKNKEEYLFKYVAQITSLNVDGVYVQANDISIYKDAAYVACNAAGSNFAGAVQIIDISNPKEPKLIRNIRFSGMDVNSVYYDEQRKKVIFGGGANPDLYQFRSYIGELDPKNISEQEIGNSLTGLPSYALNSISKDKNDYYVSVGAKDGQLIKLNSKFEVLQSKEISDIRSVTTYSGGIIALAGTVDKKDSEPSYGRLMKDFETEIPIGNFVSREAKARAVTLKDGNAEITFVAMSQEGFKVVGIGEKNKKEVMYEIPNPPGEKNDTNSVTYEDELLFLANGEYGVRVYSVDKKSLSDLPDKKKPAEVIEYIGEHTMKGNLYNGKNYSANEIKYTKGEGKNAGVLFVATGVGGLNIYTVEKVELKEDDKDGKSKKSVKDDKSAKDDKS